MGSTPTPLRPFDRLSNFRHRDLNACTDLYTEIATHYARSAMSRRIYLAELGGADAAKVQTAQFWTIAEAREWAQGHGKSADWCEIRYAGKVVARHRRDTAGDGSQWIRVLPERKPAATNPERKYFVFVPRNEKGALRLVGSMLVRGETAVQVRRRLIEREGYPDNITVRRLDRKRKGQIIESAGPHD